MEASATRYRSPMKVSVSTPPEDARQPWVPSAAPPPADPAIAAGFRPARMAGLALTYFLLTLPALLLTTVPSYALPLWPAAGLALAAVAGHLSRRLCRRVAASDATHRRFGRVCLLGTDGADRQRRRLAGGARRAAGAPLPAWRRAAGGKGTRRWPFWRWAGRQRRQPPRLQRAAETTLPALIAREAHSYPPHAIAGKERVI
jgi:hypothetical protein